MSNKAKRQHAICLLCMLAIFIWTSVTLVLAQTTTGSIYGTVADATGAVVPNAAVIVTNVDTGESHKTQGNGSGGYVFQVLNPGNYNVSTTVAGFQSMTQSGIVLSANQNVQVNFRLHTGSTSQTVTVSAATTLVDTRESQLGETVDQKRIEDLPLNGRDAYDLVQLVPGVTHYAEASTIGDHTGTQFSVNGLRPNMDSFYLDGSYDNAVFNGGGNIIPNPDALQEFRILTSNFDAEFGQYPGGVVNIITRSGTNKFHGLAYDYLRNNVLNAQNYFSTTGVTPLKQNQFGGNFGGPIFRNKAFFFLSYQGLRIRTPTYIFPTSLLTATAAERTGDFRNAKVKPTMKVGKTTVPYSCDGVENVICPNLLDPVAQAMLQLVPVGTPTASPDSGGYPVQQSAPDNTNVDQGLAHIDYQLTDNHKLNLTYFNSQGTGFNWIAAGNQILDYSGDTNYDYQTNAILGDIWTISPNAVNSARVFYTDNKTIQGNVYPGNLLSEFGSRIQEGALSSNQPLIAITGYWTMGNSGTGPSNQSQMHLGAFDTLNWTKGMHTVKLGGSFVWTRYQETGNFLGSGKFTFTGGTTGNALADFLVGSSNAFVQNSGAFHRLHAPDPALFAQDDWKATQRLTLNLGLRWEVYPPFTGQNNLGTFVPGVQSKRFPTAPIGLLSSGDPGVPDGILLTSYKKFAPRVGFAYDVFGTGAASLRGGYGIFYATSQETFSGNLEQQPFTLSVTTNSTAPYGNNTNGLVQTYAPGVDPFPYVVNLQNPTFSAGASLVSLKQNTSSIPYVQEYNLTVEQQYGANWSTRIAYVGSVSRDFYLARDQNAPIFIPGAPVTTAGLNARRPYKPYGQIGQYTPSNNASYNSLQATLTRRFAHRFSLLASYVWSKTMDEVSVDPGSATVFTLANQNDIGMDRGLSDLDVPQRFVASYLWAAPDVKFWGLLGREVLSGWQINGITTLSTGNPVNVTSNKDTNLDGIATDRPNIVGNPVISGSQSRQQKIAEYFNTAAFAQITSPDVPYGTSRRNPLIGPGFVNTDLSAFKTFPIVKGSSLQFRGEIFNVFNNVNLGQPNGVYTSGNFGKVTGLATGANPRIVQFALRYMF